MKNFVSNDLRKLHNQIDALNRRHSQQNSPDTFHGTINNIIKHIQSGGSGLQLAHLLNSNTCTAQFETVCSRQHTYKQACEDCCWEQWRGEEPGIAETGLETCVQSCQTLPTYTPTSSDDHNCGCYGVSGFGANFILCENGLIPECSGGPCDYCYGMPRPIHCLAGCEARECTTAVDAANFLISWLGLTPVGQIERLEILLEFAGCGVGIYEVITGIVNGSISIPEAAYEIVRVCPEQLMNKTSGELLAAAGDIEEVLRRLLDPCGKIISN